MVKLQLEKRVENIEETLKILNTLPERMGGLEARVGSLETHFLQFRLETRAEFSAIREEMKDLHEDGKRFTQEFTLKLHEDAMAQMRTLHEDLVARIKVLGER